jgi:plasmid stability protein
MMAQLLVRDLDEAVLDRLKERARQNRRSLQGEAKAILEASAATYTREEALGTFQSWQEHFAGRQLSDSALLIREDRDT